MGTNLDGSAKESVAGGVVVIIGKLVVMLIAGTVFAGDPKLVVA